MQAATQQSLEALRSQLQSLDLADLVKLSWRNEWWNQKARANQKLPPGDWWTIWLLLAGRGFGKGLSLDTVVPTPKGLRTMGELKTGDRVFAPDGKTTRVVAHDPYTPAKMYCLTFSTGETVEADGDHLWFTQRGKERARDKGKVRDTNELFATLLSKGSRAVPHHYVPVAAKMQTPERELPIDPYLFGAWLGDGVTRAGYLCLFETEMIELVSQVAPDLRVVPSNKDLYLVPGLQAKLKTLGCYGDKHVPEQYLLASPAQRLALLQGLMDTDGSTGKDGLYCAFGNTNFRLIEAVRYLTASLGLKPRVYAKTARLKRVGAPDYECPTWEVHFTSYADTPIFRLSRKQARLHPAGAQAKRHTARTIVSCEEIAPKTVRCLTVDHPGALYCVTESFIPTHNTKPGAEETGWFAATQPDRRCAVVARSSEDLRSVCFEGESGLLASIPYEMIKGGVENGYNKSLLELTLTSGSIIKGYPATEPNRLRGPQFHFAWCDELAAWLYLQEAWDMLQMCMRLGEHPRIIATTTPKPKDLIRDLINREGKDVVITRGSTYENRANLAPTFFDQILKYEGTTLGRQEIHAEVIDPEESGIIKRSDFKLWPAHKPFPKFIYILQSYDTAFTQKTMDKKTGDPDYTASQTWGVFSPDDRKHTEALLLDCWQERLGYPELRKRVMLEADTLFGPETEGRRPDTLVIENQGSGKSLIQDLRAAGRKNVLIYNPGNADKLARLHLASPYARHGCLWLPESPNLRGKPRTWTQQMLSQICSFAGEGSIKHDDHVDSFSQGVRTLAQLRLIKIDFEELREVHADDIPRRSNPYAA